jgi:hypothetical protein
MYIARPNVHAQASRELETQLWSGIDIDIPTEPGHSKCTPEGTMAAVVAPFQGGADGVILSRKYSGMKLVNLKSARLALQNLGLA